MTPARCGEQAAAARWPVSAASQAADGTAQASGTGIWAFR
jgi:hypothetical protein